MVLPTAPHRLELAHTSARAGRGLTHVGAAATPVRAVYLLNDSRWGSGCVGVRMCGTQGCGVGRGAGVWGWGMGLGPCSGCGWRVGGCHCDCGCGCLRWMSGPVQVRSCTTAAVAKAGAAAALTALHSHHPCRQHGPLPDCLPAP